MTQRLKDVREALEVVHRRLIEAARADWERQHGPVGGAGRMLDLLMNDPFFAWLRPMSKLMAEIDEALEAESIEPARKVTFRARLEVLLLDERYLGYLQTQVDLVIEHAALRRALERLGP
jgi:hypothetical protein